MEEMTCRKCGAPFKRKSGTRKINCESCSPTRRIPQSRRGQCAKCGKDIYIGKNSRSQPVCLDCKRTAHGSRGMYENGCRCDECTAAQSARVSMWANSRRNKGYVRPSLRNMPTRTCATCGVKVRRSGSPAADGLALCDKHRREKAARDKEAKCKRERKRAAFQRRMDKISEGVPANPNWILIQGTCRHCGEVFTRRSGPGGVSPYCSNACNRRHRKPRGYKFKISLERRLAIYDRDNWTCQICHEPIDRKAGHLTNWAPTLDHIEPQSHARVPDHSDANLRTAHRWCNSVRGDLTYYTDADLQGVA